jgi:uncharacterized membrane protein YvbJ
MICNNCGIENDEKLDICRSCGSRLTWADMANSNQAASVTTALYAGFWKRAAAAIIDSFLLFFVGTALGLIFIMATNGELREAGHHR